MDALAAAIAARGRMALILGLAVGLGLPDVAEAMRPAIWPLVITLLFLSILRIGPDALRLPRRSLVPIAGLTLTLQVACPLAAFGVFAALGLQGAIWAQALVLILAAAPITGAAPITVLAGGVPDLALRQTVFGTLVLPLTALPVLALIPAFGTVAQIAGAAAMLLLAIGCAAAAALVLRRTGWVQPTPTSLTRIDALTAVAMGLVVVGLMSAAADAIRDTPGHFLAIMALVFAVNFGLQATACLLWPDATEKTAVAVAAGNRNAALFLGVLPAGLSSDLLLVIGCYQVPMYLTPFILPWIRNRTTGH